MEKSEPILIQALRQKPVPYTPIWLMRQAGRYLPEYRSIRSSTRDFVTLCKSPDLACEVTLQPIRRFDLDAAIIFTDILVIPDALGCKLYFEENEGPKFHNMIQNQLDIKKLKKEGACEALSYVMDTIKHVKRALDPKKALIGFAGSPWTLACYMLESSKNHDFMTIRQWMYQNPEALHQLLIVLEHVLIDYLDAQIDAGVDVVMLFDSWGGLLNKKQYQDFSLYYIQKIIKQLKSKHNSFPIILFAKNYGIALENMADSGCHAIGLDWTVDIKEARKRVGNKVALQGNLDPAALFGNENFIKFQVEHILQGAGPIGHIFNLGHGIHKDTPIERVEYLIHTVKNLSRKMNTSTPLHAEQS